MAARARRGKLRSGVVLVTIIVLIVVSLALFGLWTKSIVREHDRQSLQQFRVQAERLAEAGIERARARRSADGTYSEETWSVPAAALDNLHAGQVRIHVTANKDGMATRYEATAEFPVGTIRHAQRTKNIELPNPRPTKTS
jgi:Tfp pilus assembly protein PilV